MMKQINLMYHDIYRYADSESGFSDAYSYKMDVLNFKKQIRLIAHYNTSKKDLNLKLTFDDGGVCFYSIIAPILEEYHLQGHFMITTDYIGSPGFLSSDQIRELAARGHIIGSHSHSHPDDMTKITECEMKKEWQQSIQILSDILNTRVTEASVPNGRFSSKMLDTLVECGITDIYTSIPSCHSSVYSTANLNGRYVVNMKNAESLESIFNNSFTRMWLLWRYYILKLAKLLLGRNYHKIWVRIGRY